MTEREVTLKMAFLNRKVVHVDARAINVVHFTMDDGQRVSIGADSHHHGIPIVQVEKWDIVEKVEKN